MDPSLSTDGVRSGSRIGLAAFPAPILLGFISSGWRPDFNGTIRPSDSLNVICRPRSPGSHSDSCVHLSESEQRERLMSTSRWAPSGQGLSALVRIVGHTRSIMTSVSCFEQEPQGLTGCLDDMIYSASGRATPGLLSQLAVSRREILPSSVEQTLGRIQQIQNFGAHVVHRRKATPGRFTLNTFLCTLQRKTSVTSPALWLHVSL